MALYAFDGTNDDLERQCRETSVLEFFRAYDGGPRNDDPALKVGSLYLKGIGTRSRAFVGTNRPKRSRWRASPCAPGHRSAREQLRGRRYRRGCHRPQPRRGARRLFRQRARRQTSARVHPVDGPVGRHRPVWRPRAPAWLVENARRDGLPINRAAIIANASNSGLAQEISDHVVDANHRRTILATDLLHTSVQLEPGIGGRLHNKPHLPVARIDDAGRIQEVVSSG
jgi:hypothetical protein